MRNAHKPRALDETPRSLVLLEVIMEFFVPCWIALANLFQGVDTPSQSTVQKYTAETFPRLKLCEEVGQAAKRVNIDPILAISVAFVESGFSDTESSKKAKGPLGVVAKYHCPKNKGANGEKCDLIAAGISAIEKTLQISDFDYCSALAIYNRGMNGKCEPGRSEYNYALAVLDVYMQICAATDSCHTC